MTPAYHRDLIDWKIRSVCREDSWTRMYINQKTRPRRSAETLRTTSLAGYARYLDGLRSPTG